MNVSITSIKIFQPHKEMWSTHFHYITQFVERNIMVVTLNLLLFSPLEFGDILTSIRQQKQEIFCFFKKKERKKEVLHTSRAFHSCDLHWPLLDWASSRNEFKNPIHIVTAWSVWAHFVISVLLGSFLFD